jgi:hypothetical protein
VEIERPRAQSAQFDGPELREGLKALAGNPFFKAITSRLRTQRYALESRLKESRFDRIEDVSFVQSGVFWTGWLEREIARLTEEPQKPELTALDQEIEAFQQIDSLLERVGTTDN